MAKNNRTYSRAEENYIARQEIEEGIDRSRLQNLEKENISLKTKIQSEHDQAFQKGFESGHQKGMEIGYQNGLKAKLKKYKHKIFPIPKNLSPPNIETKIIVFDTSVLMQYPDIINNICQKLEGSFIFIIPNVVSDELDENKSWSHEAREVSRFLNKVIYAHGAQTSDIYNYQNNRIILADIDRKEAIKRLPGGHRLSNDKIIVLIAAVWRENFPEHKVWLLSLDNNLLNYAGATTQGINILFPKGSIPKVEMPKPYEEVELDNETLNCLNNPETGNKIPTEIISEKYALHPNTLIKEKNSAKFFTVSSDGNFLLESYKISKNRDSYFQIHMGIKPRNTEQKMALNSLLDPKIPLVFLIGTAGTGKTLLALLAALLQLEISKENYTKNGKKKKKPYNNNDDYYYINRKTYERITISRPHVPMTKKGAGGGDIGWLPGDEKHKMAPWLRPVMDNLKNILPLKFTRGKEHLEFLDIESIKKQINIEALTYIRGRSYGNEYMIIDEAQNLEPRIIKTILTRPGEDTKIILTGDPYQIDNQYLSQTNNGLVVAAEISKHLSQTATHVLEEVERSELAKVIGSLPF